MAFINAIKGKVALIAGGASGLGKATVEHFVKQGARVMVVDKNEQFGKALVEDFGPKNCLFSPCDVSNEQQVIDAVNRVKENFGKLDIVVNTAGYGVAFKIYNFNKNLVHGLGHFEDVLRVNLTGTFNIIRLSVGLIGENEPDEIGQRGVIINTSSVAAFEGQMGQVAYAASKGGIASMTLPLARDLAVKGIRVVTIAPGVFDTPLLHQLPAKIKEFLGNQQAFPNRLGNPMEYAHLCQTIVENSFLNGTTIRLDAGIRMQS